MMRFAIPVDRSTRSEGGTMTQKKAAARRATAVFAFGLVALAGCQDASGPDRGPRFDVERALADYRALDGVLDSRGLRGFAALGTRVPSGAILGAAAADGAAGAPLISAGSRGKTFVYDPLAQQYTPDPTRTGAPADGVRFVLYLPGADGNPDVMNEIGHADLIDLGPAGNAYGLRLIGVEGGRTFLDYAFQIQAGEGQGVIDIDGYLQDATNRLEFAIDLSGSDRGGEQRSNLTFKLGIPNHDFSAEGDVRGKRSGEAELGELKLTVRHGPHSIGVDATGTKEELLATFTVGGELFAKAKGAPSNPTIVGANGDPITEGEAKVLARIVHVADDVFEFVKSLVDPVDDLLRLGIVL